MSKEKRGWRGEGKGARAFAVATILTFAISFGRSSEAVEVSGRFTTVPAPTSTPTSRIGACPGMIRSDCEADILEIPNTFDGDGLGARCVDGNSGRVWPVLVVGEGDYCFHFSGIRVAHMHSPSRDMSVVVYQRGDCECNTPPRRNIKN